MDLFSVLPDFPTARYAHVIATLEKAEITVKELLFLDALEIAKQTQVPVTDVRRLARDILNCLHKDLGIHRYQENEDDAELLFTKESSDAAANTESGPLSSLTGQLSISTLDPILDAVLAGGIRTGYVTEIAGESGCGKTQLLLHLLLAVQLSPPRGLGRGALYISTEGELPTTRLMQLLTYHPLLSCRPEGSRQPSLENIHSITTVDLETQDHILNFQVPIAIERYNIGLVVIDSITANYRAELSAENPEGLIVRARELKLLGHLLRNLAAKHNIAVVVANQVSDQFGTLDDPFWTEAIDEVPEDGDEDHLVQRNLHSSPLPSSNVDHVQSSPTPGAGAPMLSSSPLPPEDDDAYDHTLPLDLPDLDTMLSLDHQKPFFTGWGDPYAWSVEGAQTDLKAPALGLVWTNQIGCRIVLKVKYNSPTLSLPRSSLEPQTRKPETVSCPPSSITEPLVPDSEESDDDVFDGDFVSALENEHGTTNSVNDTRGIRGQSQTPVGPGTTESAISASHPETTDRPPSSNQRVPQAGEDPFSSLSVLSSRRTRVMEVVFSPWTSGSIHDNANYGSDDRDAWEDMDDVEENCAGAEVAVASRFEPSTVRAVEFEILPTGIRGIR
ncbi:hypothetical protein VTO42DRAFT_8423 [Malbranchea cinnamomea]